MAKKVLSTVVNVLCIIIIILSICLLLMVVINGADSERGVFGFHVYRVLTGSMEPEIPTDSLILVKQTDPSTLKEGDVITFHSSDPVLKGAVNTHRIQKITEDNGEVVFVTKGDANQVADPYPVSYSNVVGVLVFSSYFLGKLVRLIVNPLVFIPLIAIPLLLIILMNIKEAFQASRKASEEEEAQALREALEKVREERKRRRDQSSQDETEPKDDDRPDDSE